MSDLEKKRLGLVQKILEERRKSSQAFVQYMNKTHEYQQKSPLYMREAHCIIAIGPGAGKTMSQIAQELSVTHGAVSQIASRLEKKGYLLRQKNPANRRQTIARLTPLGEQFYEQHLRYDSQEYAALDRRYLGAFSLAQLGEILDYEQRMTAHFVGALEKNK